MSTTAEAIKTHMFYARGRNERLVRQPLNNLETATGRQVRVQERVDYDFAPDGRLTVREGQDMLPDGPLDPVTGELTLQDALAWLTAHPLLNERFWHDGHEPGRPLPTDSDFLGMLTEHTALLQSEPIEVMLEQERATHARTLLLEACERALTTIAATIEAERARADAEAQELPPEA